jgi:hypothetical protein
VGVCKIPFMNRQPMAGQGDCMRSLYLVLFLLVSMTLVSNVGHAFASPTLTVVITANNGSRMVDVKIMGMVLQPWGKDCGGGLYGWDLVEEQQGISVDAGAPKMLHYELPSGPYFINVWWIADVGGLYASIGQGEYVQLYSDATVNLIVN